MLPILYSFRRCPYAIRARMALKYCEILTEIREVVLSRKPDEMMRASPKGTVPILILPDGSVIDESIDIVYWALSINDPDRWQIKDNNLNSESIELIELNDFSFKYILDHYKYAVRFPEHSATYYRNQAEKFLLHLENLLSQNDYLFQNHITTADIAIFPFIRQFAFVDKTWFDQSPYKKLQAWLDEMLTLKLFNDVMQKYPRWRPGDEIIKF